MSLIKFVVQQGPEWVAQMVANAIQSHQPLHQWLATVAGGPHKSLAHNNGAHNSGSDHTGINHSGQPQSCQSQWPNQKCQPQTSDHIII